MTAPRTTIIAEAGVNHNGDPEMAIKLIDAAADAGADMVKFQTFNADQLVTRQAPKADYQKETTDADERQYEMIRRLELSIPTHKALIAHCDRRHIDFFSTGFDIRSVEFLAELGLDRFKIPSGEITNLPYLRHVGTYGKPVILSTGMATLAEIEEAVEVLEAVGTPRSRITILQCNTAYPTPVRDANLRAMLAIRDTLGVSVGLSDHTEGIEVAIAAVALGAEVIEKHFTLDRSLPGPDHKASLEPDELTAMVRAIRNVEIALGDGKKYPTPSEIANRAVARRSIVAAVPIHAGEKFTPANLAAKRPGTGVSPMRWDEVVGQTATRDYAPDEIIEL